MIHADPNSNSLDPSKGDMHNRQGLSFQALWMCLTDYHMYPIYVIGLSWLIPTVPMQSYITLNLVSTPMLRKLLLIEYP